MLNENLLRYTGIRGVKSLTKKEKQDRELSWNARFYIERMPDYDAAKDKYMQNLLATLKHKKILIPSSKTRKVRIRSPKGYPKPVSTKGLIVARPTSMKMQHISKLKSCIENYYIEKTIPIEFLKIYFELVDSCHFKVATNALSKHLNDIIADKSPVQLALKAVKARERAIQNAKFLIDDKKKPSISSQPHTHAFETPTNYHNNKETHHLNDSLTKNQDIHLKSLGKEIKITECTELLNTIVLSSIQVIEFIQLWRAELSELDKSRAKQVFYFHGKNYLAKMLEDLKFLRNSIFCQVFDEKIFENFIPNFGEKTIKLFAKRYAECESILSEESAPTVRETLFDMRNKKKQDHNGEHGKLEVNLSEKVLRNNENPIKLLEKVGANSEKTIKSIGKEGKTAETTHNTSDKDQKSSMIMTKPSTNIPKTTEQTPKNLETPPIPEKYYLEPTIGNAENILENYSKTVPKQIKDCLGDPLEAYHKAFTLKFPALLWVKTRKAALGMFILNVDHQKTTQNRLYISHVSSTSIEALEIVINHAVEYASSNYPCDEIRVNLASPANAVGKYESDKTIKQYFDKLGFRWKVFIKDSTGYPMHILGLACKKSLNSPNDNLFKDSLQFVYACTGQILPPFSDNSGIISALGVCTALKYMGEAEIPSQQYLLNILSKASPKWVPPAFKLTGNKSIEDINEELNSLGLDMPSLQYTNTFLALSSVELNWNRFLTTTYNGQQYLYIYDSQIQIMASGDMRVFIVPTEDYNFSAFIIPLKGFKGNAFEKAYEILSEIKNVDKQIDEIWVPDFNVKVNSCQEFQQEDGDVVNVRENAFVRVTAAIHNKGCLEVRPKDDAVVINSGFLFGLIHSKVDDEFSVPYFAVYSEE
ncbi:hypothetical protein SteCoe_10781 [Stentor coeruleus]|uniref:Uncharacterized protein n=1 Tax=Stentor coeruleus TaxID=5963 RepID=A0A1R2CEY8_9CILI|nr:hypothetical protein SteCoe_10781 [Stentor coeruleus]